MRIFSVRLHRDTKAVLRGLTTKYHIGDPGFVEDLFVLVRRRGAGLSSEDQLQKKLAPMVPKGTSQSVFMVSAKRRLRLFKKLFASFLGSAIRKREVADPIESVERLLAVLLSLLEKMQKATCLTCALLSSCNFGIKYGNTAKDVTAFFDVPSFMSLVHAECPAKPEVKPEEAVNLLVHLQDGPTLADSKISVDGKDHSNMLGPVGVSGADLPKECTEKEADEHASPASEEKLLSEIDEDLANLRDTSETQFQKLREVGGYSNVNRGKATYGKGLAMVAGENFVTSLSVSRLVLFNLAQKFTKLLNSLDSTKFKPAPLAPHEKGRQFQSAKDILRINPVQHGMPSDIFSAKLARKDFHVREYEESDERQKAFFVLLDATQSMSAMACTVLGASYSRSALALAFSLAVFDRVAREKGVFFLAPFDTSMGSVISMDFRESDAAEKAKVIRKLLCALNFNGGGTNIGSAIKSAINTIRMAKNDNKRLAESEILLITDGEDYALSKQIPDISYALGTIPLNVLDLLPLPSGLVAKYPQMADRLTKIKEGLMQVSDNYCQVKDGAKSFEEMVTIIGGTKKSSKEN